jgi:hypothetical protein
VAEVCARDDSPANIRHVEAKARELEEHERCSRQVSMGPRDSLMLFGNLTRVHGCGVGGVIFPCCMLVPYAAIRAAKIPRRYKLIFAYFIAFLQKFQPLITLLRFCAQSCGEFTALHHVQMTATYAHTPQVLRQPSPAASAADPSRIRDRIGAWIRSVVLLPGG